MRLFEAKKLDDNVKLSTLTVEAISDSLSMVTQAHVWHWQTKEYAAHKALGDFYESLQSDVDELAEVFMGSGGKLPNIKAQEIVQFDKSNAINLLTTFKNKLNDTQATFMEKDNVGF